MKNFESRIKKLEEKLNFKSNAMNVNLDVSRLSISDIEFLSDLMKRINADGNISKLTPDDEVQLNNIIKRQQEGTDTEEN